MRRIHLPKYLPLNVVDRQFLVPETDDIANGAFLPMTIAVVVRPRIMPSVATVQDALILLDNKFPQFRLGYTLDPVTPRWIRVTDEHLTSYLQNRVQKIDVDDLDEHLSTYVRKNLSPIEDPLKIFVCNKAVCIHMYHPFGDAIFLFQFTASLLAALFEPENFEQADDRFLVPLREVVMKDFSQTMKVFGQTFKRIREKATNYVSGPSSSSVLVDANQESLYRTTVTGTKMHVMHVEIPPDRMSQIQSNVQSLPTNQKISLNTYFQVYFAFRLNDMGLVDWPVELTTLVNLRRYMKYPESFFPGNCISNIRLAIDRSSFADACNDYQNQLYQQIDNAYALSDIVGNWLLASAGDTAYKQANRNWYLNISPKERRFFTLTNAGQVDDIFKPVSDYILPDIRLITPIMGSPPLVIAFTSFNNYGHFTATYKPDILSREDIHQILDF